MASSREGSRLKVAVAIRPARPSEGPPVVESRHASTCVVVLPARSFACDHLIRPGESLDTSQLQAEVLSGVNASLLAYGQTGSGKTYTMGSGASSSHGLIQQVVGGLLEAIRDDSRVQCHATFIEVYKEEAYDLLTPISFHGLAKLEIREDACGRVSVPSATRQTVRCAEDALLALSEGARNRRSRETKMNARSSRSHAIFTLLLQLTRGGSTLTPKVQFVDLAGSERATRTGNAGEALNESIQINKGLHTLGKVIHALCSKQNAHIPYRESKLTRLLQARLRCTIDPYKATELSPAMHMPQDTLGGSSNTIMVACVSPAATDMAETLQTLQHAALARRIVNKPRQMVESVNVPSKHLIEQCEMLEQELAREKAEKIELSSRLHATQQRLELLQHSLAAPASEDEGGLQGSTEVQLSPSGDIHATCPRETSPGSSASSDGVLSPLISVREKLPYRLHPEGGKGIGEAVYVPSHLCEAEVRLMNVSELRATLRSMGMDSTGKQAELFHRLVEVVLQVPPSESSQSHERAVHTRPITEQRLPLGEISSNRADSDCPGSRDAGVKPKPAGGRRTLNMNASKFADGWRDYLK
ncbi:MAG: hypothetical protein SGPRY_006727 [Prymnesium sp.]